VTDAGSAENSVATDVPPAAVAPSDDARSVGRGGLAITFAKAYFILMGLVQQILLPRVLGLDGYGALSSVLSAASITYNPIVTTSIQGVSRAVVQAEPGQEPAVVRRALLVHAGLAVCASAAFFAFVPSMATFMKAPHIEAPLATVSLVLLFYGLYSPLIGVLNGKKRFVAQATFDVVFGTLRTAALVIGGVLWARSDKGPLGSVIGFVSVAALIVVVAAIVVGTGRNGPTTFRASGHLSFIAPVLAAQVLLNLLLQADITLLRRFAGEGVAAMGLAPSMADPLVGAYRATQLYSFLPYQLLVSVTFILFPMLAQAHRAGERELVARYVTTGVRIALIVAGAMVSVTSGLAEALLRLVYSNDAAVLGERSMQVLTLGFGAFAILGVLTSVLSSLGKERSGAVATAVAFALVVFLCFAHARGAPFGEELLFRTAVSTTTGLVLATACAAVLVRFRAGAVVNPLTFVRVIAAVAVSIAVARSLPHAGAVVTLAECALVVSLYAALLTLTREFSRADLARIAAIVRKKT
jgi:stage V sporulation protein B